MYWTSHKDDIPAYFVTSYKHTVLFRRRGSTLYAAPVISAGSSSSTGLVPCIMGLVFSRCAEAGLLDYYPTPSSLTLHHSAVPKAAAAALAPLPTCSVASQHSRGAVKSLSLGFGNEDPHAPKNPYSLVWLTSPHRDFGAKNIRSIACSSRLGFGHMGNVYRGITDTGSEEVAVKIVAGRVNRGALRHEWEIYGTLMGFGAIGDTIPVCYGFAECGDPEDESGFSVLVLECIGDGKPAVADFCQLPPQDRSVVASHDVRRKDADPIALVHRLYLFRAMRDLHNLGFVNRDLTSRNVVRDKLGRLRILDLEHVRHHTCHPDHSEFTRRCESVLNCEDFRCTVVRLCMDDF